jgi:sulfofructose kinase
VGCVGIAVLDIVLNVPALPTAPGKYRATRRTEVGGGVAANAAATIAALGGDARFFGCLGDDEAGDRIAADLAAWGVAVGGVRRVVGEASPLSAVLVDADGERLIVNHAGAALFTDAAPVQPSELDGVDAVLTDMRWPGGAIPALRGAAAAGKPAIVDCDHDPAAVPGIIEAATHVVFALPTLCRLTGCEEPEDALRAAADHTPAWVAATAGSEGVYWLDSGRVHRGPAFPVNAVDTLGAGDVFHGAFALAVGEGRALPDALRWASAAAAVKCTRFGGREGIPHRNDLDTFLEGHDPWI